MSAMDDDWYRANVPVGTGLEVDPDAIVSPGDDPGAWVQCWVWVQDPFPWELAEEEKA